MKLFIAFSALFIISCSSHDQKLVLPLLETMKCWAHVVPQAESLRAQTFRGYVSLQGDEQGIPNVVIAARSLKNGSITTAKTDTKVDSNYPD